MRQRIGLRPARLYEPEVWHRDHRWGLGLVVVSTLGIVLFGFLGPSAVTLSLGPRSSPLPPWYAVTGWNTNPNDWVSVIGLYVAISLGAVGMWILTRATLDGWRPRIGRLMALGVGLNTITALVPPMTSADVLMYASYGRLQVLGRDPYEITVGEILRSQYDPVVRWVEAPWVDTPTVYGPIVSGSQLLANYLGGASMHDVVFWLQVLSLLPMIGIGLIVVRMARGNPLLQTRAALFTLVNPAMIWAVVAQAHNESLAVVLAIAAIACMRRWPALAGVLIGLAGGTKVNMVLYGLAMVHGYWRQPKKLAAMVAGAAVPLVLCYVVWQPEALISASRNTTYVNAGAWAGPVFGLLSRHVSWNLAKIIINVIAVVGWAAVAWMLSRLVGQRPLPGVAPGTDPLHDPTTVAIRTSAILYVSWLVTTPNSFSWYDLLAWAPLALAAGSRLDVLVLWRTTWLSLAFVTGRAIDFAPGVALMGARVRDTGCVIAQVLVVVEIVRWYRGHDKWLGEFRARQAQAKTTGDQADPDGTAETDPDGGSPCPDEEKPDPAPTPQSSQQP